MFEKYFSETASISKNTLFDMDSVTKIVVTTMLSLIAIDKGLLLVDDSIDKFYSLPEDKKVLTVRYLVRVYLIR